jgi:IS30 family transposase
LTHDERQEVWRLFSQGESRRAIGRALGRHDSSIGDLIGRRGGVAPVPASRAPWTLTLGDRETISRGLAVGSSYRQIAMQLDRPTCTVSREVARHGGRSAYRATLADERAWANASRPKACKLAGSPALQQWVSEGLERRWSPKQIAAESKRAHPDHAELHVSHETIYRTLFIQGRGALRKELAEHLRGRRPRRRARRAPLVPTGRGQIKDAVSIRERPAEAEDRAVPGHWEGDLICGAYNSQVATLVERHSRYVMLVKVAGKDTESVVTALAAAIQTLPDALKRSLTWDRGMEMAAHAKFTVATDVRVYFCDPHSPWQRGSNENTNGLLRQYLPRAADLSTLTQAQLDAIADEMNDRPRQTLGWFSPNAKLREALR